MKSQSYFWVFLFLIGILINPKIFANDLYVNYRTGSSTGTGTLISPVRTIAKAVSKAIAGDVIHVYAGGSSTYYSPEYLDLTSTPVSINCEDYPITVASITLNNTGTTLDLTFGGNNELHVTGAFIVNSSAFNLSVNKLYLKDGATLELPADGVLNSTPNLENGAKYSLILHSSSSYGTNSNIPSWTNINDLTITDGAKVTLPSSTVINGCLTIDAGCWLDLNGNTLESHSDIVNMGYYVANSGIIKMVGQQDAYIFGHFTSSNQAKSILGSRLPNTVFSKLSINKTSNNITYKTRSAGNDYPFDNLEIDKGQNKVICYNDILFADASNYGNLTITSGTLDLNGKSISINGGNITIDGGNIIDNVSNGYLDIKGFNNSYFTLNSDISIPYLKVNKGGVNTLTIKSNSGGKTLKVNNIDFADGTISLENNNNIEFNNLGNTQNIAGTISPNNSLSKCSFTGTGSSQSVTINGTGKIQTLVEFNSADYTYTFTDLSEIGQDGTNGLSISNSNSVIFSKVSKIGGNLNLTTAAKTLTLNNTNVSISSGVTLDGGDAKLNGTANLTVTNDLVLSGTAVLDINGNVSCSNFTYADGAVTIGGKLTTTHNLSLGSGTFNVNGTTSKSSIGGNIITNTASSDINSANSTFAYDVDVAGTIILSLKKYIKFGGILALTGNFEFDEASNSNQDFKAEFASANQNITSVISGDLLNVKSNSTEIVLSSLNRHDLKVSGNVIFTLAPTITNSGDSRFVFDGTNKTITLTASNTDFKNVEFAGSLTIDANKLLANNLYLASGTVNPGSGITLNDNGTITRTNGIFSNNTNLTLTSDNSARIVYSNARIIETGYELPVDIYSLTLQNASNVKLTSSTTCSNLLKVDASDTLETNSKNITVKDAGIITVNGNINGTGYIEKIVNTDQNSSDKLNGSGTISNLWLNFASDNIFTFNSVAPSVTSLRTSGTSFGSLAFDGTTSPTSFTNLTLDNKTTTLTKAVTVNGTFTHNAGTITFDSKNTTLSLMGDANIDNTNSTIVYNMTKNNKIIFGGTNIQTVNVTGNQIEIDSIEVNKANNSTVTITDVTNSKVIVSKSIILTSGNISSGSKLTVTDLITRTNGSISATDLGNSVDKVVYNGGDVTTGSELTTINNTTEIDVNTTGTVTMGGSAQLTPSAKLYLNSGTFATTSNYNLELFENSNVYKYGGTFTGNLLYRSGCMVNYNPSPAVDLTTSDEVPLTATSNITHYPSIYVNNSGKTVTLDDNRKADAFTLSAGTFTLGSNNITILGDLTNDGTINANSGALDFTGSTDNSLTGTFTSDLPNIIINKTTNNSLTLTKSNGSTPVRINGNFTMQSGTFNIDQSKIDSLSFLGNYISNGGTFVDNNKNTYYKKNYTGNGNTTLTQNGTYTFDGSVAQNINVTNGLTLGNTVFNNPRAITISDNLIISDNSTLNIGKTKIVITDAGKYLQLGKTAKAYLVRDLTKGGMVIGSMKRYINSNPSASNGTPDADGLFPIANTDSLYRPCVVTFPGSTDQGAGTENNIVTVNYNNSADVIRGLSLTEAQRTVTRTKLGKWDVTFETNAPTQNPTIKVGTKKVTYDSLSNVRLITSDGTVSGSSILGTYQSYEYLIDTTALFSHKNVSGFAANTAKSVYIAFPYYVTLSGKVTYAATAPANVKPLGLVRLYLKDANNKIIKDTVTNLQGKYAFTCLKEGFTYSVVPEKKYSAGTGIVPGLTGSGIDAADATLLSAWKTDSNTTHLSNLQKKAAFAVNSANSFTNGSLKLGVSNINTRINNWVTKVGAGTTTASYTEVFAGGTWAFSNPAAASYSDDATLNITGLTVGDIDANRTTTDNYFLKVSTNASSYNPSLSIVTDDEPTKVSNKHTFGIPVKLYQQSKVSSMTIEFTYPKDLVEYTGITSKFANWSDGQGLSVVNNKEEGTITLFYVGSLENTAEFTDKDDLFTLNFKPVDNILKKNEVKEINLNLNQYSNITDAQLNVLKMQLKTQKIVMANLPESFSLDQNYPNPFNPATKINFSLPVKANVRLQIYNSLGQLVTTLVNDTRNAGYYTVDFNANNFASGVYFYNLSLSGENGQKFVSTKKMMLIK